jgi:hypothetical protein
MAIKERRYKGSVSFVILSGVSQKRNAVEAVTQPTKLARPGFPSLAVREAWLSVRQRINNMRFLGFARNDKTLCASSVLPLIKTISLRFALARQPSLIVSSLDAKPSVA